MTGSASRTGPASGSRGRRSGRPRSRHLRPRVKKGLSLAMAAVLAAGTLIFLFSGALVAAVPLAVLSLIATVIATRDDRGRRSR